MTDQIVTFGMPVYNEAPYLDEAIATILAQTRGDFLLHISDNASTDGTEEICRRYAAGDSRVRYERQPHNIGAGANFRHVLAETTTRYFVWAGGHDRWAPEFLELLMPLVERPGVVLAYPRTREIDAVGELGAIVDDDNNTLGMADPVARYLKLLRQLQDCSLVYGVWYTEALKACPIRAVYAPDLVVLVEAALLGEFVQCPEVLFYRRIVRSPETPYDAVRRAYRMVVKQGHALEGSAWWWRAKLDLVTAHLAVLADRKHPLTTHERLWLAAETLRVWSRRILLSGWILQQGAPGLPSPALRILRKLWRLRRTTF